MDLKSLSFLNLTEEELVVLKIKAAMYSNGDIQQYIKGMVLSDTRPVPDFEAYCASCRRINGMITVYHDEEFFIPSQGSGKRVIVEYVPKHKCRKCGAVTANAKLSSAIEEALERNDSVMDPGVTHISFQSLVTYDPHLA